MRERYLKYLHKMQAGVAFKMGYDNSEVSLKHLRVGINAAMSDQGGLVRLLIDKGLITEEEYIKAVTDKMEEEAKSYQDEIENKLGKKVELH